MSEWTLGAVKARGMELVALCEAEGCRQLFAFNLEALIAEVGAEFLIADVPAMACPQCGATLVLRLSFPDPPPQEEED